MGVVVNRIKTVLVFRDRVETSTFGQFSKRQNDGQLSTINFTSMPNPHHLYYFGSIVNFVDDAIVAYTSTPVATGTGNFLHPAGRGFWESAFRWETMRS